MTRRTEAIAAVQRARERRDTRGQAEAERRAYEATHKALAKGRTAAPRIKLWPVGWPRLFRRGD